MRLSRVPWRLVIGGLLVYLVGCVGLLAASTRLQFAVVALAMAIGFAPIAAAIEPYAYRVAVDVRRATDAEIAQLRPLFEEFDLQIDRIWVHDGVRPLGPLKVNGSKRVTRETFVDEVVLTDCSESERRALLAWETAIVRSRHRFYQPLALVVIFEAYLISKLVRETVSSASGLAVQWYYLPEVALVLLSVVIVYRQRQEVYAADDYACDVTTPNTLAHLIERLIKRESDRVVLPRPAIWLLSVYWMSPTPGRRLDRLREQAAK